MSSTFSNDLRLELIGTGDQAGVWGATTNTNLGTLLEAAIAGNTTVTVTATKQALNINYGLVDEARCAVLILQTALTGAFEVYAPPAVNKLYVIYNNSTQAATIYNWTALGYPGTLTAAGTGITIPAGKIMTVWTNGTNFLQQNTAFIAPALGTPASGNLSNCTSLSLTAGVSGTLPVANGGTGVTTSTGTGNVVLSTSPTLVTPILGTPQSGNFSTGTFTWPTFNQSTSGNAAGLSSTLVVGSGGTGGTATPTSGGIAYGASSIYAFTAAGSTGQVLTSAGSGTPTWTSQSSLSVGYASSAGSAGSATNATSATTATNIAAGAVGDIPYQTGSATTSLLSAGTAGYFLKANGAAAPSWEAPSNFTAGNVSGTVAVGNGGTGSTTASGARTNLGLGSVSTINTNASTSNFLRGDGTWVTPSASVPVDTQTFTSTGTWTKPSGGQTMCQIQVWGGGGGGGRGSTYGGGGGGGYVSAILRLANMFSSTTVTVGAGGTGRTSTNGVGTAGGSSQVTVDYGHGLDTTTLIAYGGGGGGSNFGGGGGGQLGAGTSAGAGGIGYASYTVSGVGVVGDPTSGGKGHDVTAGNTATGAMYGGGGGACASSVAGSSMYGGGGGAYTSSTVGLSKFGGYGGNGTGSGDFPAGGGGSSTTSGGNGSGGYVVITSW